VGEGVNGISYHPEDMKLVLEELCLAAGVTVHFHTRVVAVHKVGRRVNAIVTESKSGREAWQAGTFIDATGDGDVGALAGCEFEIGMADACPCQPVSMDALLVVKDATKLTRFIHGSGSAVSKQSMNDSKKNLLAEIKRGGFDPSYQGPTIFPIRDNLLLAMMNHEYGINATDAAAVTKATLNARAELHRIVKALRALGGDWEGLQIVATPEQIGIRDGRRIKGRYKVVKGDLVAGARHEDSVVRATFSVDVHALTRKDPAYSNQGVKVKPYDIPLRALIAKDVDGLMMAGRCISGDFIAHASYRVTGNAVAMGEAAGVTSALAAASKRAPHEVSWSEASALLPKVRQG
jgi:hypothetical protein